jgi:hypothetical protein
MTEPEKYIVLKDERNCWYVKGKQEIHVASDDPKFHDGNGGKPGTHYVFNCDPMSTNYGPKDFNRLARRLRDEGALAPLQDAPEYPTDLKYRPWVIAEIYGISMDEAIAKMTATPPASMLPQPPQLTLVSQS